MEQDGYKIWIGSQHRLLDLHLKELVQYRDLLLLLVKRDFIAGYKQTVLGPLWAIIQPFVNTVFFTLIFSDLAKLTTADSAESTVPAFLFYMAGNICWGYFSSTVSGTSSTFLTNLNTMSKVYYPRLIGPLTTVFSHLISFGIQMGLFLVTALYCVLFRDVALTVTGSVFLLIPCILQMMLLSMACGLIISSLTTKYRDLNFALGFVMTLWQYASPVVYGLTLISEQNNQWLWLYMLNPITPVLTSFRYALLGTGYFSPAYFAVSWLETLVLCAVGLLLFGKMERSFVDTI